MEIEAQCTRILLDINLEIKWSSWFPETRWTGITEKQNSNYNLG